MRNAGHVPEPMAPEIKKDHAGWQASGIIGIIVGSSRTGHGALIPIAQRILKFCCGKVNEVVYCRAQKRGELAWLIGLSLW